MSLKRIFLKRLAGVLTLATAATLLTIPVARAGVNFGTATSVNPTALTSASFSSMQATLDGSTLVAAAGYSYLLKSIDSGTTWSAITSAGIKNWGAVAINDSGTVIVAAENPGSIWISTNSGSTWTQQTSVVSTSANWYSLDTNASGSVILASNQTSQVFTTTNTGGTWIARSLGGSVSTRGVAISATGDKMVLNSYGDTSIYLSLDTGATWVKQTSAGTTNSSVMSVWMSRDGQRILYGRNNGASGTWLGISQNSGSSWETVTGASTSIVALSATDDLANIWLAPNGANTYYSTNYGANWSTGSTSTNSRLMFINPSATRWVSAAGSVGIFTSDGVPSTMTYRPINLGFSLWSRGGASTDGSVLVSSSVYGEISVSGNGGATWTAATSLGRNYNWGCVAVSGDGNVIYVGGYTTRMYKSIDKGQTWNPLSGGSLSASTATFGACATNSDGTKVAVSINGTGILISNNTGATFSLSQSNSICTASYEVIGLTMTSDGNKLAGICSASNTPVITSSNGGTSWTSTTVTTTRFWKEIKSSADGSILIASVGDTFAPKISTDWGASWSAISGVGVNVAYAVSISSTGSLILIGQTGSSGAMYYSVNRGASFTQVPGASTGSYSFAAISGDTSDLIFGVDGRQLQTMTVSLVITQSAFSSITLSAPAAYRTQVSITATLGTVGADGKVTFYANGKKIPGCIKVNSTSLVATCNWKPGFRGSVTITASINPLDGTILPGTGILPTTVGRRSGLR